MIPDEEPSGPAGIGHNSRDIVAETRADQLVDVEPYRQRRDEIIASAERKKIRDRFDAGDAGDIIKIAGEVWALIDANRRARTDPLRKAAEAGKGVADDFWQPVEDALADLRGRLKAWTDAEDERIAQQQREQEEAMAAMRAPVVQPKTRQPQSYSEAAPAAPRPTNAVLPARKRKYRGGLGATVTTLERTSYRVTDVKLVPDFILNTPTVHDAIAAVVKSMAKHMGDIPGIEKIVTTDNQIL